MHNPKLNHRLHRLSTPTLFIRGASDGLVGQSISIATPSWCPARG